MTMGTFMKRIAQQWKILFFWLLVSQGLVTTLLVSQLLDDAPRDVWPDKADDELTSPVRHEAWMSLFSSAKRQIVTNVLSRQHNSPAQQDDITMLTHASVGKFPALLIQIRLWGGPVSAAIYLTSSDEVKEFVDFVSEHSDVLRNTSFHVLFEKKSSAPAWNGYPHNELRNLAMSQLESDYFLAMDVDLMTPLPGCYQKLRQLLESSNSTAKKKLLSKTLLVLPAFEDTRREATVEMLPQTKQEVLHMVRQNTLLPFCMKTFKRGHGPTDFPRWYKDSSGPLYVIQYGFKFEPYVMGYRHGLPRYWPDFRGFGFDKYSWFLEAHYMGFKFAVLRDHFVVHMSHFRGKREASKESVAQWRRFKSYLMNVYSAPPEELEDQFGFADQGDSKKFRLVPGSTMSPKHGKQPSELGHVSFNLTNTEMVSSLLTAFKETYLSSEYGVGANRARRSDSGKHCFLDNSYCREVAELPEVLAAVRDVLKLPEDSPLFLWGVKLVKARAGREHSLHTDREFAHPECGPHSGATAYILIERSCAGRSPLRLFSGSHLLNFTCEDELARINCWSEGRNSLPCDPEALLEDVRKRHASTIPTLEVVDGPDQINSGIVWPSTAWHMTKDTCDRKALILQYTTSLRCARKLRYKRRGPRVGQEVTYPELYPFLPVGTTNSTHTINLTDFVVEPFDHLRLPNYTRAFLSQLQALPALKGEESTGCSTVVENDKLSFFRKKVDQALFVQDYIYVSGEFERNKRWSPPIGVSYVPESPWVKSKTLAVNGARTVYFADKRQFTAHGPHIEIPDEICVTLRGRINTVVSSKNDCSQTFDSVSLSQGQVILVPSGIAHTMSPDVEVDGEQLCFKIFPYHSRNIAGSGEKVAPTSRIANTASGQIVNSWPKAGEELDLFYFRKGSAVKWLEKSRRFEVVAKRTPMPGYDRFRAKIKHFEAGETYPVHVDSYDLIAVALKGEVQMLGDSTGHSVRLPEHQYAFVPAGVLHGFNATNGETELLFIEIGIKDKK